MSFLEFLQLNLAKIGEQTLEHLWLSLLSLALAVVIAVPLGVWISGRPRWSGPVLGFTGVLQTIPSIALLGFMIPLLGIGWQPAVFALFLYALLPIVRNTFSGIQQVDPAVVEAARGMGMTGRQILTRVQLPLALPVLFAGIRTAAVINVGVATIAAYIGAGGLGEFIFGGIALNNTHMILTGAVAAALLAILIDQVLALVQRSLKNTRLKKTGRWSLGLLALLALMAWRGQHDDRWQAGFDPEFAQRPDGYPRLQEVYGLEFNTLLLNAGLMYRAVDRGAVDVISGYSTDGRIKAFGLTVLEDDRRVFPPYFCAPLIRSDWADEHPELIELFGQLDGRLNDSLMTDLNYQVDFLQRPPEAVAKEFLQSIDLWRPDSGAGGAVVRLGSKPFSEQYILVHIYSQLIEGWTGYDTELKTGLGGTKICFEALRQQEIDLYPEYTGTGLQVLLDPSQEVLDAILADEQAVFNYVQKESDQQFDLRWLPPLGFNNTYCLITRKELAEAEGWTKVSDLVSEE